jgi:hypothetical protein
MTTAQAVHFDHIVIFVADLNQAIEDFNALGFYVTRGGSHGLTDNALITFSNNTYIELLALKPFWHNPIIRTAQKLGILQWLLNKKGTISSRLLTWVTGGRGPVDWVVRTDNLARLEQAWRDAGLNVLKSETFSRKTEVGDKLCWYLGGSNYRDLPILLEDITPYAQRVPAVTQSHPNQAMALLRVQLNAQNAHSAAERLSQHLNSPRSEDQQGQPLVRLGNVDLCFAENSMPHNMQLEIACANDSPQSLDSTKCHGIQINLLPHD